MSVLLLICAGKGPSLTGSGGLAGVDVSDDDDVDMSLFLTIEIEDMSEMLIDIAERRNLTRRRWNLLTPWWRLF